MTPIERISVKSQALELLGLKSTSATKSQIRSAYRERVREKHPDRCSGDSSEFLQITEAFEFLCGETEEFTFDPEQKANQKPPQTSRPVSKTKRPSMDFTPRMPRVKRTTMSRPVSRPSVKVTETVIPTDVLAECKNALGKEAGFLTTRMRRAGGSLTYLVPVRVMNEVNRVALPTLELSETGDIVPTVVTIPASEISGGAYRMPEDLISKHYPGVRGVNIRFVAQL